MKEKLSKLAILDTLLAKKEPLSEAEEVVKNKLLVHQPSDSEEFGGDTADSGYSETEELIRRGQAQLSYNNLEPIQVEDTIHDNVDDGECHVWKWWDEAVMEEMRARDIHKLQLAEKVDYLNILSDYETHLSHVKDLYNVAEQKLVRLEKIVCVLVIVLLSVLVTVLV
ncbi:hypothetical protein DY000_02045269 [Brassica cretica]|uniref:NAB domain-containing protein n=1 Tax=Brassica cretica TaxID=69181 RepID=A0ABQ7ERI9_BRACR|nr:hypothetical protein DY000_02045269 [Brassica cretica]